VDWMSPQDASFLHIEGANTPMHIGGVSIFEGPAPPFERLEEMVAAKLDASHTTCATAPFLPPARRRSCAARPPGSSPSTWIAEGHCGRSGRSRD
jgi:hypothetical protein